MRSAILRCYAACTGNSLPTFRKKTYWSHLQGWNIQETSVRDYKHLLRKSPEEGSSRLLRGLSLKSRLNCLQNCTNWLFVSAWKYDGDSRMCLWPYQRTVSLRSRTFTDICCRNVLPQIVTTLSNQRRWEGGTCSTHEINVEDFSQKFREDTR